MAWVGSLKEVEKIQQRQREQAQPPTAGKKPKVLVAIPNRLGEWTLEFTEKVYVPLKTQVTESFERIFFLCRLASISAARNLLVKHALSQGCSHIFFLDSDIILENPVNAIEILLQCNEPIVSGMYRRKNPQGFEPCMFTKVDIEKQEREEPVWGNQTHYTPVSKWTGNWLTVDVVGMGLCLINTEVFRKIQPPWFEWSDPDGISEDFALCEKARKVGYKIHVLTDVQAAHVGILKVMPDGTFRTLGL